MKQTTIYFFIRSSIGLSLAITSSTKELPRSNTFAFCNLSCKGFSLSNGIVAMKVVQLEVSFYIWLIQYDFKFLFEDTHKISWSVRFDEFQPAPILEHIEVVDFGLDRGIRRRETAFISCFYRMASGAKTSD